MRCRSWVCRPCGEVLAGEARRYLIAGASELAPGEALTWWTLTDGAEEPLDFAALGRAFDRTRRDFSRRGWWRGYFAVVEVTRAGRLHCHVVSRSPHHVAVQARRHGQRKRSRAQWHWHFNVVSPTVARHGWGRVCDVEQVGETGRVASYAVKALGDYSVKQTGAMLREHAAARLRPARASQDWTPGRTWADFTHRGDGRDPGPWEPVPSMRPC